MDSVVNLARFNTVLDIFKKYGEEGSGGDHRMLYRFYCYTDICSHGRCRYECEIVLTNNCFGEFHRRRSGKNIEVDLYDPNDQPLYPDTIEIGKREPNYRFSIRWEHDKTDLCLYLPEDPISQEEIDEYQNRIERCVSVKLTTHNSKIPPDIAKQFLFEMKHLFHVEDTELTKSAKKVPS